MNTPRSFKEQNFTSLGEKRNKTKILAEFKPMSSRSAAQCLSQLAQAVWSNVLDIYLGISYRWIRITRGLIVLESLNARLFDIQMKAKTICFAHQ